jgi:hypothetical protein
MRRKEDDYEDRKGGGVVGNVASCHLLMAEYDEHHQYRPHKK